MVLSLSKVVKDIMLVGGSTLFLGERLTPLQGLGYAIGQSYTRARVAPPSEPSSQPTPLATIGLLWYKVGSN